MLFALQRTVLAALGELDASDSFALAGGAALIVHGVVNRTTRDLDLFTEESRHVATLHQALTGELVERGLGVTVISATETFVRLEVHDPGSDERIEIDLGVDVRMAAPVTTEVGRVLSIDELAADKLLAVFGRAELRDFLDVADLLGRSRRSGSSSSQWPRMRASRSIGSPSPSRHSTASPTWTGKPTVLSANGSRACSTSGAPRSRRRSGSALLDQGSHSPRRGLCPRAAMHIRCTNTTYRTQQLAPEGAPNGFLSPYAADSCAIT
jgi:hypothetical protein